MQGEDCVEQTRRNLFSIPYDDIKRRHHAALEIHPVPKTSSICSALYTGSPWNADTHRTSGRVSETGIEPFFQTLALQKTRTSKKPIQKLQFKNSNG
jgi:hypothetical protein